MKYEFLRRKRLLISVLIIFVFLEAAIYLGLNLGGNWYITATVLMFVLLIGGLLFPLLDAVTNYYSDFKRKNGYMLFLTPNKGGRILGTKALFAFAEIVIVILLIWAAYLINIGLLKSLHPEVVNPALDDISSQLQMVFNVDKFSVWTVSPLIVLVILQYFTNMMLAILAITIAKTILSNKDFNWLFALIFYFVLAALMQAVNVGVLAVFGFVGDIIEVASTNSEMMPNVLKYLSVGAAMYIVWSSASIIISSALLNKRTDL
jgi:hypothetical protein